MTSPAPTSVQRAPGSILRAGLALMVRYVRRQPWAYAFAATGAVVFTSGIIASAYVIGRVTDDTVVAVLADEAPLQERLRLAVALIAGVAVWKTVGIIVRRTAAGWLQGRNEQLLRRDIVAHQLDLTLAWYGSRPTGELLSVAHTDGRQATEALAPLPFATGVTFLLPASVVVIVLTDVWLGLLAAGLLLLVMGLDLRGTWATFTTMEEVQRQKGRIGDIAHESFDGALTIKALGRSDLEGERFAAATDGLRSEYTRLGTIWGTYRTLTETLPAVGGVLVLLLGAHRIAAGELTAGELVRVAYLLTLLSIPMRLLGYLLWDLGQSVAAWERVSEVLAVDDAVVHGGEPAWTGGAAHVGAQAVDFSYRSDEPVLRGVEIDVRPGRTLAVVGPTGSGKSSLALLLARMWDPERGAVTLDGRDLRSLRRGAVPAEVAYVAQDAFLFDDTVLGNITLGLDVSLDEVRAAAELAGAGGFIAALPEGYETRIGERGTTLSGGQQQRVALARALIRRPRLLVLDDATSALDPSVERAILERLITAELPSTVVVVAYRRASITLADDVLYLEDGRVAARGSHDELVRTSPGYARLLHAYEQDREDATGGVA